MSAQISGYSFPSSILILAIFLCLSGIIIIIMSCFSRVAMVCYALVLDDWCCVECATAKRLCLLMQYLHSARTNSLWRHQMEIFSALLAICAGNLPVTGEFPAQRPLTGSFDVFFDRRLNKRLSKQSWGWWFQTPSRHYDVTVMCII